MMHLQLIRRTLIMFAINCMSQRMALSITLVYSMKLYFSGLHDNKAHNIQFKAFYAIYNASINNCANVNGIRRTSASTEIG